MTKVFYGKSIDMQFKPSNQREWLEYLSSVNGKELVLTIKRTTKIRTDEQNNALHLYFEFLSKALNEAGYTVQLVLKEKIDLDWDKEKVKELLWRPAQQAITGKKSTTQLDKQEDITNIYEHLNRHLSEKFGIHVPFPVDENKQKIKLAMQ